MTPLSLSRNEIKPVKERPILFSVPMVQAILAGRKTQTRRMMKPQPIDGESLEIGTYAPTLVDRHGEEYPGPEGWGAHSEYECISCPYGKPGDRLYVRENFQPLLADGVKWSDADYATGEGYAISYPATDGVKEFYDCRNDEAFCDRVTPSIYMPRWASRITLEITEVRVQRLQEISAPDAIAEGVQKHYDAPTCITPWRNYRLPVTDRSARNYSTPQSSFMSLWDSINGDGSNKANPWVWAVSFKMVQL